MTFARALFTFATLITAAVAYASGHDAFAFVCVCLTAVLWLPEFVVVLNDEGDDL